MKVNFYFEEQITLRDRNKLKAFLKSIFKAERKKATSIDYIFCNDRFLLDINKQFLKHDYYTDIITFDFSVSSAPYRIGEIYISTDRVRENAKTHFVSQTQELHRVIIHGALHLCGYKDKTISQKRMMRIKEDQYLKKYGLLP